CFFCSSRRRHTRSKRDWSSDVCSSDLIHGFVFLCYCAATVAVWTDKRWTAGTGLLGLVSAIVPYATVPFERSVERRGLLDGPWRSEERRGGRGRRSRGRWRADREKETN